MDFLFKITDTESECGVSLKFVEEPEPDYESE